MYLNLLGKKFLIFVVNPTLFRLLCLPDLLSCLSILANFSKDEDVSPIVNYVNNLE